jgi:hypothetical protein
MAVGRLPESGDSLCSQPTMLRLENAPSEVEIARLMAAMVDQFCESYRRAPASITLDIDDTFHAVHGHQQLSLFNAHYEIAARVVEGAARIRVFLPTACPDRAVFRALGGRLCATGP